MPTVTFYPDANPETTSVDGHAAVSGSNQTLAAIIAAAGNGAGDTQTNTSAGWLEGATISNQYQVLQRGFFLFDTSSIPTSATIQSATLSLYGKDKASGLGTTPLHVVSGNPVSNTAIANGDFSRIGNTSFGNIAYASFSISGYNDITLNASGIAAITKAGISKFATRLGFDLDGSGPSWSSGADTYMVVYMADNGSNKPKLTVTYTVPASAWFLLM